MPAQLEKSNFKIEMFCTQLLDKLTSLNACAAVLVLIGFLSWYLYSRISRKKIRKRLFISRVYVLPIWNCVFFKGGFVNIGLLFFENILLSSYLLQQTFLFCAFSLCAEIRSGNQISRSRADREGAAHPAESEVMKTRLIQVAKTDVVIIIKIRKSGENRNKIENEETGMLCAVRKPGLRWNRFNTDKESIKVPPQVSEQKDNFKKWPISWTLQSR